MQRSSSRLVRAILGVCAAALSSGCDSTLPLPLGDRIILSSTQTASLLASIDKISGAHPDLAWLADSANLVIKSGAEAQRIAIVVDGAEHFYFAVSLQRQVVVTSSSFSTFHLLAFNDPGKPVDWVIANGYASANGTSPPTSVSAAYGTQNAFTHLIHVDGSNMTDWQATAGSASFAVGTTGAACSTFPQVQGITCVQSTMEASFTVTSSSPNPQSASAVSRSASAPSVIVPGVLLHFTF